MHREAVEANMSSILTQYASFQETGVITDDKTASIASLCTELSSYRVQRLCGVVRRLVPEEVIETTEGRSVRVATTLSCLDSSSGDRMTV